jgi:hypothetical protein
MELNAKLLITSTLDEKWTDIFIDIKINEIFIYRSGGNLLINQNKLIKNYINPNERTLLYIINSANMICIVKDIDNLSIRIDCKTNLNNLLGYYQIKFIKIESYNLFFKHIENSNNFRNILFLNRTYEQDKRNYNNLLF